MKGYRPLVSVIMNCYNSSRYLREAIESVYAQKYDNWEIVFWDNNSSDTSGEIANSFDSRLRYFKGEKTVPLGEARNLAIKESKGELLAFLDCDDLWFPEKLYKQVPLFKRDEVGLVFCDTIFFNEQRDVKRLYERTPYKTGKCFDALLTAYFLSMETVVLRKSALLAQKYWFDPRFNMIEEADLFRRVAFQYELDMVPEVLAKWRIHQASYTWNKSELMVSETDLSVESYKTIFPEFERQYKHEIKLLKRGAHFSHAKILIDAGRGAEARKYLWSFSASFKGLMFLGYSFAPAWVRKEYDRQN